MRSAAGPGVKTRLHEAQRQSWTISSVFLRVPRRVSAWPPQCGHASGGLTVCGTRAARGMAGIAGGRMTLLVMVMLARITETEKI